jgi:hypothetical protein
MPLKWIADAVHKPIDNNVTAHHAVAAHSRLIPDQVKRWESGDCPRISNYLSPSVDLDRRHVSAILTLSACSEGSAMQYIDPHYFRCWNGNQMSCGERC